MTDDSSFTAKINIHSAPVATLTPRIFDDIFGDGLNTDFSQYPRVGRQETPFRRGGGGEGGASHRPFRPPLLLFNVLLFHRGQPTASLTVGSYAPSRSRLCKTLCYSNAIAECASMNAPSVEHFASPSGRYFWF